MTAIGHGRSPGWVRWRLLIIPLVGALAIAGIDWSSAPPGQPAASAADWQASGYGPRDYFAAKSSIADQLDLGQERVRKGPDQWLRQESLARAWMASARLSPSYDDLAAANATIARAQSLAPAGSGPLLSSAVLAMMTHRLPDTEAALDVFDRFAVPPGPADMAEAAALRGDLSFYRGDMRRAGIWYQRAKTIEPSAGVAYRRAIVAKATGEFDTAITAFRASEPNPAQAAPFASASLALQIGAIEQARGNYALAREWFTAANREFPGFWLFEAHLAQSKAVAGDLDGAIDAMRAIARRTPSAEIYDALAMMLRTNGQARESRRWATRAGTLWERRLQQLPEAAYGHALEHELVFGTPERAIVLARMNSAARPFGESRLLLASAYLMNGDTKSALAQIAAAEQSGWRSAPMYALRAQAYELSGQRANAEAARARALALNARIFSPETSLIWFSHG